MIDIETMARELVNSGQPVPSDLAAGLLDRLARRDGCHAREIAIRSAAEELAYQVGHGPILAISSAASRLVDTLNSNCHPATQR